MEQSPATSEKIGKAPGADALPSSLYVDHNATSPMRPIALQAIREVALSHGNPSSIHRAGQNSRRRLDEAREDIRRLVQAPEARVIFTGSGSEADNLGLRILTKYGSPSAKRILLAPLEHPAVLAMAEALRKEGFIIDHLPVKSTGQVSLDDLKTLPTEAYCLAALMVAHNETGVLQPVQELCAWGQEHRIPVHVDAVQGAGKIPLDFKALGATTMALAGHKFGGPKGIGALILDKGLPVEPLWEGGAQEYGYRPGTQATALAAGMGAAAEEATSEGFLSHLAPWRDEFEKHLRERHDVFVVGEKAARLPNTSLMGFRGFRSYELLDRFENKGIFVGAGAACHAGIQTPPKLLTAMGFSDEEALSVVRFSFGHDTTSEQITELTQRVGEVLQELES